MRAGAISVGTDSQGHQCAGVRSQVAKLSPAIAKLEHQLARRKAVGRQCLAGANGLGGGGVRGGRKRLAGLTGASACTVRIVTEDSHAFGCRRLQPPSRPRSTPRPHGGRPGSDPDPPPPPNTHSPIFKEQGPQWKFRGTPKPERPAPPPLPLGGSTQRGPRGRALGFNCCGHSLTRAA